MPRKRLQFHQLSSRSKRRRVNESAGCSHWSDDSDNKINTTRDTIDNKANDTNCSILLDPESSENYNLNTEIEKHQTIFSENDLSLSSTSSDNEQFFQFNFDLSPPEIYPPVNVNEDDNQSLDIKKFLRNWSIKYNITDVSLSALLVGLKENINILNTILPSDARTLLKTNIVFEKKNIEPGHYLHIGLETQLKSLIKSCPLINEIQELKLIVNVDGLPLFKSSAGQVIPILISVINIRQFKKNVFPVGIYYGLQKPNNMAQFLQTFIDEVIVLTERGISNENGSVMSVKIVGFCCDAPAKKDILGIKGHGGYSSCTKCTVHGITVGNKRVFTELNCAPRTHEDFVNWVDINYRQLDTPLTQIPSIDFVKSIILDYLHLVCLGVMRTMLLTWYDGVIPFKLSRQLIQKVSDFMFNNRLNLPSEFARKPRELKYLLRWKGVEYRSFLLYLGVVALKGVLDDNKYNNFLTLNVAMSILLNPKTCNNEEMREYARSLLQHFVQTFMVLYNESFITHNFHGLIHLVDDAKHFAPMIDAFTLDSISAFPFENFLQKLKNMIRGKNKPLEQIGKRLAQLFSDDHFFSFQSCPSDNFPKLLNMHCSGPLPVNCNGPQYKTLSFYDFVIKIESPNNCCATTSNDIVMVENICFSMELQSFVIVGRKFLVKNNFFTVPCESSTIGIYKVEKLSNLKIWPISNVCMKYVVLPYKHFFIIFPLLHSA